MEYGVDNYGAFDETASITGSLSSQISGIKDECNNIKSSVFDEGVFFGPIADSCVNEFGVVENDLVSLADGFGKIESYMGTVSENYRAGDAQASSEITNSVGTSQVA